MAGLQFEPLHPEFGTRVSGIDLRRDLDAATMKELNEAVDTYSFLLFEDQHFDDAAQLEVTRRFGEPEPSHVARGEGKLEYFGTIGNVQPDGTALGNTHKKTIFLTGNNMWHSDASFKQTPVTLSIMCAYETPDEGGETLFASTRGTYERLGQAQRDELEPLVVIHDYVFSRSKVAPDAVSAELAATLPPVRHRLVRTNPHNGRRNLFIGSHAKAIEGWSEAASRQLLDALVDQTVGDEHVYAHAWKPGQVVFWDNRCLLHRGAGYDADKYRRYMRQTRVQGSRPTLEEAA
ncbi:MAG: TauD/TfdA dioxygenase family protein [Hyphomicrobiaceae bacterium]